MSSKLEQRRKEAMKRYDKGDRIEDICREMACSKSWLYKWQARFNAADPTWVHARSRRPLKRPTKTPEPIEKEIVRLKKTQKNAYPIGAPAIQQALKEQGLEKIPSRRTIYRILARHEKEVE